MNLQSHTIVIPCGMKSVLDFCGLLPAWDIFVINMFFKVPVAMKVADLFKGLSHSVKTGGMLFETKVFSKTGHP